MLVIEYDLKAQWRLACISIDSTTINHLLQYALMSMCDNLPEVIMKIKNCKTRTDTDGRFGG